MTQQRSPMTWIPSLYFVQGLQFFIVMLIAGLMFKSMGVPNDQNARWTGLLGLAWAFKPLWSPFLELLESKKLIVVVMQFTGAIGLALLALAVQLPMYFAACIAVLFLMAYAAATHDIACDGLYLNNLDGTQQAKYAGWLGAFFNASKFLTLGGLLVLAGKLEASLGVFNAWSIIFVLLAALLAGLAAYNAWALPGTMSTARSASSAADVARTLREVVLDLFKKPGIWMMVLFIVLFRFAEGQVQTIGPLFMKEARELGGLGLSTDQIGSIYGIYGTAAFLIGSILGGYFTAWMGLKRAMPILILCMAVPSGTFYYLAATMPTDVFHIGAAVAFENFGYGFGFVGMILFIMQVLAPGKFSTAHYALGTGVMQLGFILSKTISGDIQMAVGYESFFLWTIVCGAPVLLLLFWVKIPAPQAAPAAEPAAAEPVAS